MKTWHWVVISVVVVIVVIGIVLFVSDSFRHFFFLGGKYRVVNQYEVFRDLLAIILTLAGLTISLGGLAIYKWISKGLEIMVKEKVGEEVNYETAILFLELSYDCWRAYEVKGKPKKEQWDQLETAVEQCRKALKRANRLDTTQRKNESILCLAKNNRAYHLAARNRPKDTEEAISLAKDAYDKRNVFDFKKTCFWMETYGFVLIRMGNKKQRKEGQEIIKDLRHRRYLPKIVENAINEKYTKNIFLKESWKKFKKT